MSAVPSSKVQGRYVQKISEIFSGPWGAWHRDQYTKRFFNRRTWALVSCGYRVDLYGTRDMELWISVSSFGFESCICYDSPLSGSLGYSCRWGKRMSKKDAEGTEEFAGRTKGHRLEWTRKIINHGECVRRHCKGFYRAVDHPCLACVMVAWWRPRSAPRGAPWD